ncbi:MAG: amidohydrolase/deacetylase family metallohydrolase [Oscillospiraceae bacterium]|nr:MAG: amidohydrolase/deacetylase family metallohydrolase [Oscillospiraceae bacterium]
MHFPQKVNAYDPQNRRFIGGVLTQEEGRVVFCQQQDHPADTDLYIAPGFVDMHVHLFDGYGIFGMHASKFGHAWGVHVMSDAGSCGIDNIDAFCRYVLPTYQGIIIPKLWMNVCRFGLPSNHECIDFSMLAPQETASTALQYPGLVVGIKVRLNCDIPEKDCLVPLERALEAAELANMPLMVHISQGPPAGRDILPRLRKGDVVTHIFNGKPGSPWTEDGAPIPELLDAQERGVLFDVAHGYSSFNFQTCTRAIAHGFTDVSVSTDMHKRCLLGKPFTFTDVMTKVHACGLSLEKILYGVTRKPAEMLGMYDWATLENMKENATIFSYADNTAGREFFDAFGNSAIPEKVFTPKAVIVNGRWNELTN